MIDLNAIVAFDISMKAKYKIRSDPESLRYFKFHKKYFSKFKVLVIFLYLFLDPFICTPNWCLKNATGDQRGFAFKCNEVNFGNGTVQYSSITTLTPVFVSSLDLVCIIYLAFFTWSKWRFEVADKKYVYRKIALLVLLGLSAIDFIVSIFL